MSIRWPLYLQAGPHHITGFSEYHVRLNDVPGCRPVCNDVAICLDLKFFIKGHADILHGDGIPSLIPWEHRKVMLRTRSADRLADIRVAVREQVALRHPPLNNLRDDAKL